MGTQSSRRRLVQRCRGCDKCSGRRNSERAALFLFGVACFESQETTMTKLKLLGAAAVLSTALATPLMAQEVVQEPGATGFNYPNSNYLTGGYGQRTPWN